MLHNLLIAAHAACAVAAFVLGLAAALQAVTPISALFRAYLIALWGMVVFLVVVVLVDWAGVDPLSRVVYSALLALAVYTGWRGLQAGRHLPRPGSPPNEAYVEDVGFTLIALFDGFVIVSSIDLGAPTWLVVGLGVAGVLIGRLGIQRIKRRARTASASLAMSLRRAESPRA